LDIFGDYATEREIRLCIFSFKRKTKEELEPPKVYLKGVCSVFLTKLNIPCCRMTIVSKHKLGQQFLTFQTHWPLFLKDIGLRTSRLQFCQLSKWWSLLFV